MEKPEHPSILVVEDDDVDILLFRRMARRYDLKAQLDIVKNAEQALSYLHDKRARNNAPPIVLVTDLNMPGMSGHDLIESIRSTPHLENMVIFVVSTSDLDSDISRAYNKRVAGYIIKDTRGERTASFVQMLRGYCNAVVF